MPTSLSTPKIITLSGPPTLMEKEQDIFILSVKPMAILFCTIPALLVKTKTLSGRQTPTEWIVTLHLSLWTTETWLYLVKVPLNFGPQTRTSKRIRSRRSKRRKVAAAAVIAQVMRTIMPRTLLSGAESVTVFSKIQDLISENNLLVETVSSTL